jgi:hypothetical protein
MLNTRLGCEAKVRKVLASADEGAVRVRSLLFTYIPSPVASGPPVNVKLVPDATSELHPFPSDVVHVPKGIAAGSLLKMTLLSDTVTFPVEPESNVFMTLAEALDTKSRPPVKTAAGAKNINLFFGGVLEKRFIILCCPSEDFEVTANPREINFNSYGKQNSILFPPSLSVIVLVLQA